MRLRKGFIGRKLDRAWQWSFTKPRGWIVRRLRYAGRGLANRFSLRLEFSPREWWVVHWRTSWVREWPHGCGPMLQRRLDVWIRLVPCAPLHLSAMGPARPVPGTLVMPVVLVPAGPAVMQGQAKAVNT